MARSTAAQNVVMERSVKLARKEVDTYEPDEMLPPNFRRILRVRDATVVTDRGSVFIE